MQQDSRLKPAPMPKVSNGGQPDCVTATNLPLAGKRTGKVRDVYELETQAGSFPRILVVATDRISAFDVVLPSAIPGKGRLLTEISSRWFDRIRQWNIVPDHALSTDPDLILGISRQERDLLRGRCMICRKVRIVPIECVVRGWLAGSAYSEYKKTDSVCAVALPSGLRQWERLPEPLFTPASKAQEGHDENISFEQASLAVGATTMDRLRRASIAIYKAASMVCEKRGLILADTKFEFGFALDIHGNPTDELMLADEALTPDSSRYWLAHTVGLGTEPESLDKQFVRNWLLAQEASGLWNRCPPGPVLPADVVEKTSARYRQAADMLLSE